MSDKPLANRKYEVIAQQLARGATSIEASLPAGYRSDGSAFASNCRQRANYPQIKARVAALQAKAIVVICSAAGTIVRQHRLGCKTKSKVACHELDAAWHRSQPLAYDRWLSGL
jgi:hypothetical protein